MKTRSGFLAFILGLLLTGLGHVYAGRAQRALAWVMGILAIYMIFQWTHALSHFYGVLAEIAVLIFYTFYQAIDAWKVASKAKMPHLKFYNRWYFYLIYILFIGNLFYFFAMHIGNYRVYSITSESMAPALHKGEFIVVEYPYDYEQEHSQGDLVTMNLSDFVEPGDGDKIPDAVYLKRIVAVGGDHYRRDYSKAKINQEAFYEPYVDAENEKSNLSTSIDSGKLSERHVYVLGDNRDLSYDSRDFGPVPVSSISGEAIYILWSPDNSRIGKGIKRDKADPQLTN